MGFPFVSLPKQDDPLVKINRHKKLEHNSEISKTPRDADKSHPLQARAITNTFVFFTLFIKLFFFERLFGIPELTRRTKALFPRAQQAFPQCVHKLDLILKQQRAGCRYSILLVD